MANVSVNSCANTYGTERSIILSPNPPSHAKWKMNQQPGKIPKTLHEIDPISNQTGAYLECQVILPPSTDFKPKAFFNDKFA